MKEENLTRETHANARTVEKKRKRDVGELNKEDKINHHNKREKISPGILKLKQIFEKGESTGEKDPCRKENKVSKLRNAFEEMMTTKTREKIGKAEKKCVKNKTKRKLSTGYQITIEKFVTKIQDG